MTTRYYHLHLSEFATECTLVRTTTDKEHAEAELYGYNRISRKAAEAEIAWINRETHVEGNRGISPAWRYLGNALTPDEAFSDERNRLAERKLYAAAYGPSN